jgi:hypothetical protein
VAAHEPTARRRARALPRARDAEGPARAARDGAGNQPDATRNLSGKVIQKAGELVPSLVGGSADLDPSTKTKIKASTSVTGDRQEGRVLHFGIREHAMGGILNGLALHGGYLPMGSTFLVFSDYMRPSLGSAAIMGAPTCFVFTHDSLMVGEDGPTHQPVEHLAALRLIPNLHVFRPGGRARDRGAWTWALQRTEGPVAMALTRQSLAAISRPRLSRCADVLRGGYVLHEPSKRPDGGRDRGPAPEVAPAVDAAKLLQNQGVGAARGLDARASELVPLQQDEALAGERAAEGPPDPRRRDGPARVLVPVHGLARTRRRRVDLRRSGPAKDVAKHFGFTAELIARKAQGALLQGRRAERAARSTAHVLTRRLDHAVPTTRRQARTRTRSLENSARDPATVANYERAVTTWSTERAARALDQLESRSRYPAGRRRTPPRAPSPRGSTAASAALHRQRLVDRAHDVGRHALVVASADDEDREVRRQRPRRVRSGARWRGRGPPTAREAQQRQRAERLGRSAAGGGRPCVRQVQHPVAGRQRVVHRRVDAGEPRGLSASARRAARPAPRG